LYTYVYYLVEFIKSQGFWAMAKRA